MTKRVPTPPGPEAAGQQAARLELWAYVKTADWQANINPLYFYGDNVDRAHAPGFGLDFGSTSGGIGSIDPFTNGVFDNDNQASGVMVSMDQWVHFAMTWDGTAVKAFVNGVQKSSKAGSASVMVLKTAQSVFTLGGYPGENRYFPGSVDELRIWNVARDDRRSAHGFNRLPIRSYHVFAMTT